MSGKMADIGTSRAVIFDIRNARERDPLFLWVSQALYETALLAYASQSPRVSSLSIAVVGSKGFEILACALPLCSLDFTFQKIISKLKQQLKIPPAGAIYPHRGSFSYLLTEMLTQLQDKELGATNQEVHFNIWTKSRQDKLTEEVSDFIQKCNSPSYLGINLKVEVVSLSLLTFATQLLETNMSIPELSWKTINQEPEIFNYFKDWLKVKRENWKLEAANNTDWCVTVDVQDVTVDLSRWQSQPAHSKQESVATFSSIDATCLQLTDYIRSDALPAYYLFGIGRLITASKTPTDRSLDEVNRGKFHSLVEHLRKESWLAIARLLPPGNGTDLFVLMPSSDADKLLMRNLAPRELILPFPTVVLTPADNEIDDEFDAIARERDRIMIVEACKALPQLTELPSQQESILKAVAKKLQDEAIFTLGASSKSATPMKMRRANVKFV